MAAEDDRPGVAPGKGPARFADGGDVGEAQQGIGGLRLDESGTDSAVGGADDDASTYSTDDESSILDTDDLSTIDDEDDIIEWPEEVLANTRRNSHFLGFGGDEDALVDQANVTNYEDEDLLNPQSDEFQTAPNVVFTPSEHDVGRHSRNAGQLPVAQPGRPPLQTTGPTFERNRCTVTMFYGEEYEQSHSRRSKHYVVASDGSEGSQYAVNWAIGTVLRDGDEALVVSVMETDTKLDSLEPQGEDPNRRMLNQRLRQDMTVRLANQAFVLLQRTKLNVKVSCQAIHARNARHMLLDLIDFYAPTMVIVGSRGLENLRSMLNSMSHYLVQKSSVPYVPPRMCATNRSVMVAHNKLKLPSLPRGKADVVNNVRMRHMRLDQAVVEKTSNAAEHPEEHVDEEDDDEKAKGDAAQQEAEAVSAANEDRLARLNRKSLERRAASFGSVDADV